MVRDPRRNAGGGSQSGRPLSSLWETNGMRAARNNDHELALSAFVGISVYVLSADGHRENGRVPKTEAVPEESCNVQRIRPGDAARPSVPARAADRAVQNERACSGERFASLQHLLAARSLQPSVYLS